ncbi:uncharacterized protein LOC115006132 isoform X3 [Cottoperca gobio]|uniref:Uncharacterized protein LOC115006132 isoform X3 n=1 Tax=Cottoperca gobio TaxID=56716 RepID=A0A6J2PDD1_COTGO|nr:uncharacterized protein LOC115006132 isoform X3 [Cottoperca gobio]
MYSSASWSSSSSSETRLHHQLPRGHTYLDTLRHVSFVTVVMCKRRDAGQIVDVKTSDHHQDLHQEDNVTEADERRECMELLKEMVAWDERERITPADVLNHPFITKSYIHSTSRLSSCPQPAAALDATSIHMDNTELPPNTSDDRGDEKKKKNSCRRFFSWMTRIFCCYMDDVQE